MSRTAKLNALSRLAILIGVGLCVAEYVLWLSFLLMALLMIVLLHYAGKSNGLVREGFSITPTYTGTDLIQTSVAPLFAEEWRISPPTYDVYDNYAPVYHYQEPRAGQAHGQYMTRTNLLPSDEQAIRTMGGPARNAREYANSAFTRNQVAFRQNMMSMHKKRIARRFKHQMHGYAESFSPFTSY